VPNAPPVAVNVPIVVAAVLVLLLAIDKTLATDAILVMVTLPVPLMLRFDNNPSVKVVMVWRPPPTDALETKFKVPGPAPLASCSVNAELVRFTCERSHP